MGFAFGVTFVATELLDRHMLVVATPLNFRPKKKTCHPTQAGVHPFFLGGGEGKSGLCHDDFLSILRWVLISKT